MKLLHKIISLIAPENMGKSLGAFNQGVQDFGKSMDSITKELGNGVEKSNNFAGKRAEINKKNLEKIWGKRNE